MAISGYTYCGFTLDEIRSKVEWHEAALLDARQAVQTNESFARIDQCSQEALEWARDRLDALERALEASDALSATQPDVAADYDATGGV